MERTYQIFKVSSASAGLTVIGSTASNDLRKFKAAARRDNKGKDTPLARAISAPDAEAEFLESSTGAGVDARINELIASNPGAQPAKVTKRKRAAKPAAAKPARVVEPAVDQPEQAPVHTPKPLAAPPVDAPKPEKKPRMSKTAENAEIRAALEQITAMMTKAHAEEMQRALEREEKLRNELRATQQAMEHLTKELHEANKRSESRAAQQEKRIATLEGKVSKLRPPLPKGVSPAVEEKRAETRAASAVVVPIVEMPEGIIRHGGDLTAPIRDGDEYECTICDDGMRTDGRPDRHVKTVTHREIAAALKKGDDKTVIAKRKIAKRVAAKRIEAAAKRKPAK